MNNFWSLSIFELRKIAKSSAVIFGFIVVLAVIVLFAWLKVYQYESINGEGTQIKGIEAIEYNQQMKTDLDGYITAEYIDEVILFNSNLYSVPENVKPDGNLTNEAFVEFYRFSDINNLIGLAYPSEAGAYNYYAINSLSYGDGSNFYQNREDKLKEITKIHYPQFTSEDLSIYFSMNENMDNSFYYDYHEGWRALLEDYEWILIALTFVMMVIISPIFSNENQTKMNFLILSSRNGKNILYSSKVMASFIFSTILYIITVAIFTLLYLSIFGFTGFDVSLQVLLNYFWSPYPLTVLEGYLLVTGLAYLAYISIMMLSLLFSTLLKKNFLVIVLSTVIYLMPIFFAEIDSSVISMFPINVFKPQPILASYELYQVFNLNLIPPFAIAILSVLSIMIFINMSKTYYKKLEK